MTHNAQGQSDSSVHPDPTVWPECGNCGTPFVLRRCMSWSADLKATTMAYKWLWQQDCRKGDTRKCKAAEPIVAGPGAEL